MNSEEIIKVLNEIADKIGASAESIYPTLVRYGVVSNTFGVMASALSLYVAYKIYSKYKGSFDDCNTESVIPLVIMLFMIIFGGMFFFGFAYHLVGWIAAPEAMVIKMILGGEK